MQHYLPHMMKNDIDFDFMKLYGRVDDDGAVVVDTPTLHREMQLAILRHFHSSHFRRNNHPVARRPAPHFFAAAQ